MKKIILLLLLLGITTGCTKIPAGYTGIKVKQYGSDKGVQDISLVTGRVIYNPMAYDVFKFPTFMQSVVWTEDAREGSKIDESFTIQTKDGLEVRLNVGLNYSLDDAKIPHLFEKYRKAPREIEKSYLRTKVRNIFLDVASTYTIESLIENKAEYLNSVEETATEELKADGFLVDTLTIVGSPKLPNSVVLSIEAKIEATQKAQQKERELQSAQADAAKRIADAEGVAKSRIVTAESIAKSNIIESKAIAEANRMVNKTLTRELIEFEKIKKWDGALPKVSGQSMPLLKIGVE